MKSETKMSFARPQPHPPVKRQRAIGTLLSLVFTIAICCLASSPQAAEEVADLAYSRWTNGPSGEPGFFPLAVWLQSPKNADRFRDAGINTYVALWRGPNEEQLNELRDAGMKLICSQNATALRHLDDPLIIGWMHGDEPDNAQSLGRDQGYGPPVEPRKIIEDYERLKQRDPSRPILLNLGQGVAWDNWIGRGVRRNHPEDYPEYIKGADIVSFDIYPAVHDHSEVAGNLWFVARGVERLVNWSEGKKIVWNCIEASRISNVNRKPTPLEVRAEAWMAIVHGSRGLIYFVHQFEPVFREAALLDDAELLAGITALNRQITELAPVLNGAILTNRVHVNSGNTEVPVAHMTRQYHGAAYIFAVGMRGAGTIARFQSADFKDTSSIEVLGEGRTLAIRNESFQDAFEPWDVHIYRIRP